VFAPEQVALMGNVFEDVLKTLRLVDRTITRLVAQRIIELAQRGERDAERLKQLVLEAIIRRWTCRWLVGNFVRQSSFVRSQISGGDDGHRNGILCSDCVGVRRWYVVCGEPSACLAVQQGVDQLPDHPCNRGPRSEDRDAKRNVGDWTDIDFHHAPRRYDYEKSSYTDLLRIC
jgi:hypothetical protein